MSEDQETKRLLDLLDRTLEELHREGMEHIQILACWNEQGESRSLFRGTGNFYARFGTAHEFLDFQRARSHHETKRREYSDEP
jgi:hypothetical protein